MDGFIVYLNLVSNNTHLKQVGLPGVSPTLPVSITLDSGLRLAIWTLAPSYTVMRNDVATLDAPLPCLNLRILSGPHLQTSGLEERGASETMLGGWLGNFFVIT